MLFLALHSHSFTILATSVLAANIPRIAKSPSPVFLGLSLLTTLLARGADGLLLKFLLRLQIARCCCRKCCCRLLLPLNRFPSWIFSSLTGQSHTSGFWLLYIYIYFFSSTPLHHRDIVCVISSRSTFLPFSSFFFFFSSPCNRWIMSHFLVSFSYMRPLSLLVFLFTFFSIHKKKVLDSRKFSTSGFWWIYMFWDVLNSI